MRFKNVFLIFFILFFSSTAFGIQKGGVEYSIPIEYSLLNEKQINADAEQLYSKFNSSSDEKQKQILLEQMLWDYSILGEIDNENPLYFTRLGIIYDKMKKDRYAKSNFFRSQNLIPEYPYSAFSFGNFYYDRKEYRKALKEYLKAYNTGYSNHYDTLFKIGTIYKIYGDFSEAIKFYKRASIIKNTPELSSEIVKLEDLLQNNSLYNQRPRYNK